MRAFLKEWFGRGAFDGETRGWRRFFVVAAAAPVFLFFPFGFMLLAMTAPQLVWGFDDFPLGSMVIGGALGLVLAVAGLLFVCVKAWRGAYRVSVVTIAAIAVFDLASVPIARLITRIVES